MDYSKAKLNIWETAAGTGIWILIAFAFSYFFYRSVAAAVILSLFAPIFIKYLTARKKEKRKQTITVEFKEMIRFLSVSLQAGESVENAFFGMYRDMKTMFGEKACMTRECEAICVGLKNNVSIEKLLISLGERTDVEEIKDFTEVFVIAKRTGGNLKEIISDTTSTINSRIEMKNEFRLQMASKKLEQRIMCLIPFLMFIYLGITSPGYFDSLYVGVKSRIIMTVCLMAYIGAVAWGEHILNLKTE